MSTIGPQGPRPDRTPGDQRIEADFRLIAHQVLKGRETDDPVEIEARTDRALSETTGINLMGQ